MGYYALKNKYLGDVSRTVTINYPASEEGGSRTETFSEPIYVDLYVDTAPFEKSVDKCAGNLGLLQAGIAATEAAEVKSRRDNSLRLAKTLSRGFFSLVDSNLSMQAQESSAESESLYASLVQQKEELDSLHQRMQNDYDLMSSRYLKLFKEYDKELLNRINALDKPVFDLVKDVNESLQLPSNSCLFGLASIGHKENIEADVKISVSRMKYLAKILIKEMKTYLFSQHKFMDSVSKIFSESIPCTMYKPALLFSVKNKDGQKVSFYSDEALRKIEVLPSEIDNSGKWIDLSKEQKQQLTDEINTLGQPLVNSNSHDDRVSKMISLLWDKSEPKILIKK